MSGYSFDYLQIDGGTAEPRVFRNHPRSKGYLTFTPHIEPVFYLVGVDAEGYETSLGIYDDKGEATHAAHAIASDVGAATLYDLTEDPVASVSLLAQCSETLALAH